ncbi:MAG: hypothetical protein LH468_11825 [Nocardioides sp.]|nr:hypothetical protein [Nocardioides sp.]
MSTPVAVATVGSVGSGVSAGSVGAGVDEGAMSEEEDGVAVVEVGGELVGSASSPAQAPVVRTRAAVNEPRTSRRIEIS